jgi:DNA-binding response OmpR family regulator
MSAPQKPLQLFLKDQICLILEPSKSFSTALQSALQQMGVSLTRVIVARKFHDAKKIVEEKKPQLLITEFEIDGFMGLDLIEIQEKQYDPSARISFITTKNSSDSAVAEAAEGQVDGFILKPFTIDAFQKKLLEILVQKLRPSEYIQKINAGKLHFNKQAYDPAIQEFIGAKPLHPKPALACSFAGLSYQGKQDWERALQEFREGRKYQPLHYKCLVGEFEGLVATRSYQEAYALVEPIRKTYPITSRRLGQMFVAAVFTGHFEDLPLLYETFTKLENRTPDLINISSMALLTAGKFMIKQNDLKKAIEYFDIGLLISGRSFAFVEKVVLEFLKNNAIKEAEIFLGKTAPADAGTPHLARLVLKVDQKVLSKDQLAEKGRKLILDGHGTPEIFQMIIQTYAELGKESQAEAMIAKALETQPDMRATLYQLLSDHLKKN